MPRYSYMQNSFSAGQISPKLEGRTDISEYKNGVSELTNFLPQRSGGISRRPGLRLGTAYTNVNHPDAGLLTIPYQLDSGNIFKFTLITDVQGQFECETILSSYGTVQTAFTNDTLGWMNRIDLPAEDYHYAQVDDKVFLTHASGEVQPMVIVPTIFGDTITFVLRLTTDYALIDINTAPTTSIYAMAVPLTDANLTSITLTPTADVTAYGTHTIESSAAMFESTDVGITLLIDGSSTTDIKSAHFIIKNVVDDTHVNCDLIYITSGFTLGTASNYWYQSAWSKKRGYPKTVTFFENRLVYGGTKKEPSGLWLSEIDNPIQMNKWVIVRSKFDGSGRVTIYGRTPDQQARNDYIDSSFTLPLKFTLASNTPDSIVWLASSSNLLIGTTNREYAVTGGENGLSASTFVIRPQTSIGGTGIQAVASDTSVYFISSDRKSVYQTSYSGEASSYQSKNLSTLSDEIMFKETEDRDDRYNTMYWQASRGILWLTTIKGKLVSISIGTGGVGFALHDTDLNVRSVCASINAANNYVDMHLIGKRPAFSSTTAYSYKMVDDFEHPVLFNTSAYDGDEPVYLDFAMLKSGASSTDWNVSPYVSETVTVLKEDGTVEEEVSVDSSGDITLATATTKFIVGKPYTSRMKTLNLETGVNQLANAQQDIQRIDRVTAKIYKTWAGQYGALSDGDETIYDMELTGTSGETGSIQLDIPMSPSNDNRVIIQSSEPLPLTVSGLVFRGVNNQ